MDIYTVKEYFVNTQFSDIPSLQPVLRRTSKTFCKTCCQLIYKYTDQEDISCFYCKRIASLRILYWYRSNRNRHILKYLKNNIGTVNSYENGLGNIVLSLIT